MVKQFNKASNGDNQTPDTINQNGVVRNSYGHAAFPPTGMDVAMIQPAIASPSYLPSQKPSSTYQASWWGRLSLGTKATALAIAIGVLPVLGIGVTSFTVTKQALKQEVIKDQQAQALERQLALILLMGIGASTALAGIIASILTRRTLLPILAATNTLEKLKAGEINTRMQVEGEDELAFLGSNINQIADQVQALIEDQKANQAKIQTYAETLSAATRGDSQFLFDQAVQQAKKQLNADRVVIYGFEPDLSGSIVAEAVDPGWPRALSDRISDPCIPGRLLEEYKKGRIVPTSDVRATKYSPAHLQLLNRLQVKANLVVPVIAADTLLGLLVAHQCSGPREWQEPEIEYLSQLATQIGLSLTGVSLAAQKQAVAERAQQLNEIISRVRESLKVEEIYHAAVTGVRETLKTDRVIVYLFDADWQGTIVAESVGSDWPKALGANIADPCFADQYVQKYKRGRVKAVENIYDEGLTQCYLGQLEPFKVKANLVAPIMVDGQLLGLLVAHQCSSTRPWQESEINFFKQVAIQVGFALDQAALLEQREQARIFAEMVSQEQRREKEALQLQLLELLSDVEGAARGDLTVRADVTVGEIGTVADFFNAVIESLRGIVTQVKKAATQVNTSLGENEGAIRQLSAEALKQAEDTTRTLDSVEQMTRSIQQVAENARQAACRGSYSLDHRRSRWDGHGPLSAKYPFVETDGSRDGEKSQAPG
jgi:GAF domain-containing protein